MSGTAALESNSRQPGNQAVSGSNDGVSIFLALANGRSVHRRRAAMATLPTFKLRSGEPLRRHQSAESRISVSRLRCRFRNPTMSTAVTTIRASPPPTISASDAQLLGTQNFRATREVATATAKIMSFMVSRRLRLEGPDHFDVRHTAEKDETASE
jgi:hypothetical protein